MASLTPGALLKLLQSMNDDGLVAGDRRSAVLQVIGIVPALTASTDDCLWPSHGFYLQLSDSANSTFVTISDADADHVLSSRPQIGLLVHVDRLQFAHPVPRAVGVRRVPGARPHPIVGSPDPLVTRSSPDHRGFVIQMASPGHFGPPLLPSSSSLRSDLSGQEEEKRTVFTPKENAVGSVKKGDAAAKPRRFSSPVSGKLIARKSSISSGNGAGEQPRDPSPVVRTTGSRGSSPASTGRRTASPIPSKCEVPSLVVAKEENRRTAKEPAIIVPSRYRQHSPVGRKAAASPAGRRGSISPSPRFSVGGFKMAASPAAGEGGGKKKAGLIVAGIPRVSDALSASGKTNRESWDYDDDDSPESVVIASEPIVKGGSSRRKVNKESILRTPISISRRLSEFGAIRTNMEDASFREKSRTRSKTETFCESEKSKNTATSVAVHDKKWTDGSIPFDSLPANLAKLGEGALGRRNIASMAAAEALEEALVNESVIRSLSMFSDLCSSSKPIDPAPAIDRFLPIYDDVLRWTTIAESVSASRNTGGSRDAILTEHSKTASLWVEAALATDLQVLHLINIDGEYQAKRKASERPAFFQIDPSKVLQNGQPLGDSSNHSKVLPSPRTNNNWTRGCGMNETVNLVNSLQREMQNWFLQFVEEAMDAGFRLFGENSDSGSEMNCKDNNSKTAAVLSQLKRINDWLDGVGKMPAEGGALKDNIARLKRKIYAFVVAHVGSAYI